MRLVIVTGMSGAGRTTALKMLEDAGYFCVDNLPVPFIDKFADLIVCTFAPVSNDEYARVLKDGGKLSLCHRPERLAEVLAVLRAHRLEPKRLAFVKNKPDAAPWLFLVEAQKNRKTGLRVEPDVLISAGAALYGR